MHTWPHVRAQFFLVRSLEQSPFAFFFSHFFRDLMLTQGTVTWPGDKGGADGMGGEVGVAGGLAGPAGLAGVGTVGGTGGEGGVDGGRGGGWGENTSCVHMLKAFSEQK